MRRAVFAHRWAEMSSGVKKNNKDLLLGLLNCLSRLSLIYFHCNLIYSSNYVVFRYRKSSHTSF